jgi:hypothetical protein
MASTPDIGHGQKARGAFSWLLADATPRAVDESGVRGNGDRGIRGGLALTSRRSIVRSVSLRNGGKGEG